VHAFHLTARESYEQTVVARVLCRAARAASDLTRPFDEAERMVTAEVLGVATVRASSDAPPEPSQRSEVDTASEASRLTRLRRFAAVGRPSSRQAAIWAPPRRGAGSARAVVVVEVQRADSGGLLSSQVVGIDVTLTAPPPNRRAWRSVCRRLVDDPRVREAAIAVPGNVHEDRWATLRTRLAQLRALRHAERGPATQPSLFDRRALRAAEGRKNVRARWDEWQARLEGRVQPPHEPPLVATRVLAILPLEVSR
jgi:hypothetical protein